MRDILPPIPRQSVVSRLTLPVALLATALAAWLSQGTLAQASDGDVADRASSAVDLVGADRRPCCRCRVGRMARAAHRLTPLWLLGLLALPWLSASVPAAILIWSGRLALIVWLAIGLALIASVPGDRARHPRSHRRQRNPAAPGAPRRRAGVRDLRLAAWQASPSVPEGDEPHYLIITQSLLKDHDLQIENNHRNGDYRAYYRGRRC